MKNYFLSFIKKINIFRMMNYDFLINDRSIGIDFWKYYIIVKVPQVEKDSSIIIHVEDVDYNFNKYEILN
jgi:hypothetical protein